MNLPIPVIKNRIQEDITSKIKDYFTFLNRVKHILFISKKGVELAIEQNEDDAKKWINQEISKLDINLV